MLLKNTQTWKMPKEALRSECFIGSSAQSKGAQGRILSANGCTSCQVMSQLAFAGPGKAMKMQSKVLGKWNFVDHSHRLHENCMWSLCITTYRSLSFPRLAHGEHHRDTMYLAALMKDLQLATRKELSIEFQRRDQDDPRFCRSQESISPQQLWR